MGRGCRELVLDLLAGGFNEFERGTNGEGSVA